MHLSNLYSEQETFVFREWNRKSYAVFNSLKRIVHIGKIVLSYSLLFLPIQLRAQEDSVKVSKQLKLDEVIVTANKAPAIYSKVSRFILSVDRSDLEEAKFISFSDLLASSSPVDIRERGFSGMQADISIRGGSFDQNAVLFNGFNITDPQTGHHNLNLPANIRSISHLEILYGPGARVIGPNAFSGAVNFITEPTAGNAIDLYLRGGEFKTHKENLNLNLSRGKYKGMLSLFNSSSDGFTENTDFNSINAYYHGVLDSIQKNKFELMLGHTRKEFGANSFYTPQFPNQFEAIKSSFLAIKASGGSELNYRLKGFWRSHKDRFELFRYESPDWYSGHNYHLTHLYGTAMDIIYRSDWGITSMGVEFRSENILSNALGEEIGDTIAGKEKEAKYTHAYSRNHLSFFGEHTKQWGNFHFSTGLLIHWLEEQSSKFRLYPGIDLSYRLGDEAMIYATINKTLRLPTFTDMFYDGPSNLGNPELKPEEALSYELGIKVYQSWFFLQSSFFHRTGKNMIAWVLPEENSEQWVTQNLSRLESYGGELMINSDLQKLLDNQQILRKFKLQYTYIKQSKASDAFESKYAMNYLQHKLTTSMRASVIPNFYLQIDGTFRDRAGKYPWYNTETSAYEGEEAYTPFMLTDVLLEYQTGKMLFFIKVKNLFDTAYIDIANVPLPGRWINAGLQAHITL